MTAYYPSGYSAMKRTVLLTCIVFLGIGHATCIAQEAGDLLILQDIGPHRLDRPEKMFPGEPPSGGPRVKDGAGVLAVTDHLPDHTDSTAEVMNFGGKAQASPTVMVTRHAGADSDRWLLHEVEESFQKSNTFGSEYASPNPLRTINGNKVYFMWGYYQWISDNVVVSVHFGDLAGTKPEPLEVVHAYLQKFPSTIPTTLALDNRHKIQWIKDEMERRLWLCDKWLQSIGSGNVRLKIGLESIGEDLKRFGAYRDRYFSKRPPSDDAQIDAYVEALKGSEIKAKVKEYRTWWSNNSSRGLSFVQQGSPRIGIGD